MKNIFALLVIVLLFVGFWSYSSWFEYHFVFNKQRCVEHFAKPIDNKYLTKDISKIIPNYDNKNGFLNLSILSLSHLPADYFKDHNCLNGLYLQNNKLVNIPPSIKYLTSLKNLNLSENNISNVSNFKFKALSQLKRLNLSHNKISSFTIDRFPHMENLSLSYNKLNTLKIKGTSTITHLNLISNDLTIFPEDLHLLSSLSELHLSYNPLKVNWQSVQKHPLNSLEILNLQNSQLTSFPNDLSFLPNLKELKLEYNNIRGTVILKNGNKLDHLNISSQKIERFIVEENSGKELKWIRLSHNQITDFQFKNQDNKIDRIYLEGNELSSIPMDISNLEKINNLDLSYNQITNSYPLPDIHELGIIYLNNNYLTSLPYFQSSANLALDRLELNNNKIEILDLDSLTSSVRVLFIGGNDIQEIKITQSHKNLSKLTLEGNQNLKIIPINVLELLPNLTELYIRDTNIKGKNLKELREYCRAYQIHLEEKRYWDWSVRR